MALEDAMVLGDLVRAGVPDREIPPSLPQRRAARVRWVQDQSRRIGRVGQLDGALRCGLRNALLRCVPDAANARALRRLASASI
jgi:hypothetical protein